MPKTQVLIFANEKGEAPLLKWLDKQPAKVQDKCLARIERLAGIGHELRRPEADYLRDGIHKLRIRFQKVNYRILYFFREGNAILSHGIKKEGKVPDREIELAIQNSVKVEMDPSKSLIREEEDD